MIRQRGQTGRACWGWGLWGAGEEKRPLSHTWALGRPSVGLGVDCQILLGNVRERKEGVRLKNQNLSASQHVLFKIDCFLRVMGMKTS